MNWDWDKLQEKRQHQQGRPAPDKSRRNEPDPQAARAQTTKNFLMQFSKTSLKDVNWGCIFHYCYDDDDNWGAIAKDGTIRRPMLDIFKETYPREPIK